MIFPLQCIHVPGYIAIVAGGRRVDLLLRTVLPVFTEPSGYLPQEDGEMCKDFSVLHAAVNTDLSDTIS